MASRGRNVLLRLTGDPADARRAVREIRDEVRSLGREQARVRIDVARSGVEAQIDRVKTRIENLSNQEATPQVRIQTAGAFAQLRRLELRLDRLNLKSVNVDVDIRRGALESTAAGLRRIERGTQGAARGFANVFHQVPILGGLFESVLGGAFTLAQNLGAALGGIVTRGITTLAGSFSQLGALAAPIGSVIGSLVSLGASLAAVAAVAGAVVIVLNAIAAAVVALAGALVALIASLTAAVAGLGALAIAFGGILLPVIAVGVALFQRFSAVLQAHKVREQELAQAVQSQKTAEQQRKDALEASKTAHQQLAAATVAGNAAIVQSVQDVRDAELGLERSRLGIREARLNLAQARRDLREFLAEQGAAGPKLNELVRRFSDVDFNPAGARGVFAEATGRDANDPLEMQRRILAVQQAQLGVKDSINQTTHAEQTLAEATRKRADFARRGLRAYAPYRQALEQVRRSEIRLARAQDASTAAQRKYEDALKGLSGTERGTLRRINDLTEGFTNLAKALTDPIFAAINSVFDSLRGRGTVLRDALGQVGRAMGDVVRAFGAFLREPRTLSAFRTMAGGAATLVRELGARAFISFLRIMREIATAALPAVEAAARRVSAWLARIAGQPGAIHRVVRTLVEQFKTWAAFAGAVARLVIALFSTAAPAGRGLAASMTRIVNRWTAWIRANPDEVRRFFRDAVRRAKEIVHWLGEAFHWLAHNLPRAAETAKHAFEGVYRVVQKLIDSVRWLQNASTDISNTLGTGASPKDVQRVIQNDLAIVNRDMAQLRQHQTPERRTALRKEVIEALKELLSRRGSVGRQIHLSDEGRHKLEALLQRLLAAQLHPPRERPSAPSGPSGRGAPHAHAGTASFHAHITVPGGHSPDERSLLAKMAREAGKLGLVG